MACERQARPKFGPTAVPGGRTTDIGSTMDLPKDMSVPRIIITVIAAVDQTHHTTISQQRIQVGLNKRPRDGHK